MATNFLRHPSGAWWMLALLGALAGCHRSYYRERADVEAESLIQQKANHPHWALPRATVDTDPRSRMFDPFDPDCPPMPPDDPTSHALMICVDGMKGYPGWDANGHTPFVENPQWMASIPFDENGVVNLTAVQAYQLALLHSRDFQRQFETLYLSALDVSTERFRFDTQFFGGGSAFYTTAGRLRPDEQSRLELGTYTQETGRLGLPAGGVRAPSSGGILMRKSFATGADLVVGLANSLVWDFAGPDQHSALTILDFSLLQPLLRRAGRDRILEQLTIAERALLANVRQMERFRRAFYVEIMTGRDAGQGASRRGGFFGGSGLEGFSGVGSGGFGRVGGVTTFGGGTGAAQVGGYLGLLQDQLNIRNQQTTITGLRSNLAQLRESLRDNLAKIPDTPEIVLRERLQIAQARQALLNAESRLLNSQAAYQTTLDTFKINLGVPPQLCVNIADSTLDPFNLIDPQILAVQDQVTQLRNQSGDINERILARVASVEIDGQSRPALPWTAGLANDLAELKSLLGQIRHIRTQVTSVNLKQAEQDIRVLANVLPRRRQQLSRLHQKYNRNRDRFQRYGGLDPSQMTLLADAEPMVFNVPRLDALKPELQRELTRILDQFQSYREELDATEASLTQLLAAETKPPGPQLYEELERKVVFAIPSLLSRLSDDVLDLSLVQARARTDAIQLMEIELNWDLAFEIARRYRRDWMNARAALVDTWRLIEFNADSLESNLDIVFEGDIRNTGDNPLRLRSTNGQLRAGLRFDAPITRLQERNTYRQALIEYQQAKRDYCAFVDGVANSLRNTIRNIDLAQINFEERRIAVLSAIDQVVLNDQIQKLREESGLESGVTAARDVVSALGDLQTAQNDFVSVRVNYEFQRLILDLDLGTMKLDPEGNWIDPGPIGPEQGYPRPDWDLESCELLGDPAGVLQRLPPDPATPAPEEVPASPASPEAARPR